MCVSQHYTITSSYLYKLSVTQEIPVVVIEKNIYPQMDQHGSLSVTELQASDSEKKNLKIADFCRWALQHGVLGWRQDHDQNEIFLCARPRGVQGVQRTDLNVISTVVLHEPAFDKTTLKFKGMKDADVPDKMDSAACTGNVGQISYRIGARYNGLIDPNLGVSTVDPDDNSIIFQGELCSHAAVLDGEVPPAQTEGGFKCAVSFVGN